MLENMLQNFWGKNTWVYGTERTGIPLPLPPSLGWRATGGPADTGSHDDRIKTSDVRGSFRHFRAPFEYSFGRCLHLGRRLRLERRQHLLGEELQPAF
jgi:hypothetical protein